MSEPTTAGVVARVAAALAEPDAERALLLALNVFGFVADAAAADPRMHVIVSERGRSLASPAAALPADASTRDTIVALLRLGIVRADEAEQARRLRERYDMLSQASFEGILINADGVVVEVNQRLAEMLGYTREELLGPDTMRRCIAPEDLARVWQIITDRVEGEYVITAIRKDGSRFRAELLSKQGLLGEHPVRIAAARDVTARERIETERKQLEEQMQRAQRLESLGMLAGGVAHDFNNLLVGVLGNAELLLQSVYNDAERQAVEAIRVAGQRAAALTTQLLTYAGQRDLGRRDPIDLAVVWRELGDLPEVALSKRAKWRLAIEPHSVVLGERANISQLLMNLLTNASDSLGDRAGDIAVCTQQVSAPDARWAAALGNPVAAGNWVLIEVKDSGCGMSAETLQRIFEPFFSTKQRGQGLGLPACLGIVKAHGGAILVESELGRGTVVSVLLPAAAARAPSVPAAAPRASTPAPAPAQRSVLVVDDELPVRTLLRRALERRGFAVREAADGRSALAAMETA
ncbi:MAG TPA: ATP-binding protein, partial [Polyangiales bacterium]|nr:ATP-binding protein [Polyangiales bacterium]